MRAPAVSFFPPIRAGNYHFLNDTERYAGDRDDPPPSIDISKMADRRSMANS